MTTAVFLLEEPSARALLEALMPRLYPDVDTRYLVFEGMQDLENNLARRIRGWRAPDSYFIVLRDQDSGDCRRVKSRLTELVAQSGAHRPGAVARGGLSGDYGVAADLSSPSPAGASSFAAALALRAAAVIALSALSTGATFAVRKSSLSLASARHLQRHQRRQGHPTAWPRRRAGRRGPAGAATRR